MADGMPAGAVEGVDLLVPHEVAAALRVSLSQVRRYLRSGALRGVKMGGAPGETSSRRWRVRRQDLERFVSAERAPG